MFELFQSEKTSKYHFRLKARNGEQILQSQAYGTHAAAMKGIQSVANNGVREEAFEQKEATNGKHYFVVKAANHQVIAQSQQYKTKSGCEGGIKSVIKNCQSEVRDLTEAK